jgi:uncharacterized protein with PQ loop repeat
MEINPTVFGLLATGILITTLVAQTIKQWREHATRGIARWFFLGQVSASVFFIIYSLQIDSVVFAIANGLILLSALAGYLVLRANRRRLPPLPSPQRALARRQQMLSSGHHSRVAIL